MNLKFLKAPHVMEVFMNHRTGTESEASFPKQDNQHDELSGLEEFEEAFADHMLMEKRLRKRLYAGDFTDLKEFPEHPPIALTGLALELFSKAVPNYGLDILDMDYVASASEAARISPCAMILAMIYLERLQLNNSDYLETASPSGLFVVTMLVASKFLFEDDDDMVTNQMWADALNLDIRDLNNLEFEFLSAIDWKVYIDSTEFFTYLSDVERVVAFKQSAFRGWLSFSDICVIAEHQAFCGFWTCLIKRITKLTILSALGYIATAFALQGSGTAIQMYIKPTTCSSNSTESTHSLTSNISMGVIGVTNESSLLQPPITKSIDNILIEKDSISLKIYVTGQECYERYSDLKGIKHNSCHLNNNVQDIAKSPNQIHYALHYMQEKNLDYFPYQNEKLQDNLVDNSLTFRSSNVPWNLSCSNGQNFCLSLRVRECY